MRLTITTQTVKWFTMPQPSPEARLRVFCLPYAGADTRIFRSWPYSLPESAEVCAINLPGRYERSRETPFTSMTQLVGAVARAMLPYVDKAFVLFGHSFGGLVSFELARELRRTYGLEPAHLFVSGCVAPREFGGSVRAHGLSEPELLQRLKLLGGISTDAMENLDLMQMVAPILRADLAICEAYAYSKEAPLDCPITGYGGLSDFDVKSEQMEGWREETSSSFSQRLFNGDHFFLHSSEQAVLADLRGSLARLAVSID